MADAYTLLAVNGYVPPNEFLPKAKEAVLKALEIDDTLAEAHTTLGFIETFSDWDWSDAEREFQRAIQLNPSYATAHQWYCPLLWETGRLDEAMAESKRALQLDPVSVIVNWNLGQSFYYARRYDETIEQLRKTLDLDPNSLLALLGLGRAYVQKSKYKEGIAEFEKVLVISPNNQDGLAELGYAYSVSGQRLEAQKVLDQLTALSKEKYIRADYVAKVYVGLGEKDKAIVLLEKSYDDRSIGSLEIKMDPAFDPLRSDPRFNDLLRRMNLQP